MGGSGDGLVCLLEEQENRSATAAKATEALPSLLDHLDFVLPGSVPAVSSLRLPPAVWTLHEQVAVAALDIGNSALALSLVQNVHRAFPEGARASRLTVRRDGGHLDHAAGCRLTCCDRRLPGARQGRARGPIERGKLCDWVLRRLFLRLVPDDEGISPQKLLLSFGAVLPAGPLF